MSDDKAPSVATISPTPRLAATGWRIVIEGDVRLQQHTGAMKEFLALLAKLVAEEIALHQSRQEGRSTPVLSNAASGNQPATSPALLAASASPIRVPAAPHVPKKELLTVMDLAQLLSVSRATVWRLRDSGKLPMSVRLGSLTRWRAEVIAQWLDCGCPRLDEFSPRKRTR